MRNLIVVLLCLLCLKAMPKGTPAREAARLEQDVLMGKMPDRVTYALEVLLNRASVELKKKGYKYEADQMMSEWRTKHKRTFLLYATASLRDIGDHAALNQFLGDKLKMLELILGTATMKATHLSDLYTFIFTPPIVFRPASFPMDGVSGERIDEYRRHFNEGGAYYGLVPVSLYWIATGACLVGTSGIGSILCGAAATVGEKLFATFIGPKLSDWVFNKANGIMIADPNEWQYWESEE